MDDDVRRAALAAAEAGRWDDAHRLAQRAEGDPLADWIHAVVHKVEGDLGNSRYWYRRAGRVDHVDDEPRAELALIRAVLGTPRGGDLDARQGSAGPGQASA